MTKYSTASKHRP